MQVAARTEATGHASLYRARQEDPSRKMQELEAVKATVAELFARRKEAVVA